MEPGELFRYIVSIMPQMWVGISNTLILYFAAIFPALIWGFFCGVTKAVGPKPVRLLLGIYTWAWRGTPLLLQLMIATFGLRIVGIHLPEFLVITCAFALNMGAYITEIMRAAILSVDRGQYEACAALSMPRWKTLIRVIIPQSIRIAIPPACSEAINLVKDIAIIAIIGWQDIVRVTQQIGNRDHTFSPYIIAFIAYLLLTTLFVKVFGILEKKSTSYD